MTESASAHPSPDADETPSGPKYEPVPFALRWVAIILLLQGIGLLLAGGALVVKTIFGHPDSAGRSLLGAALAVLAMLALVGCARGLLRLRPAARTPVVVLELLALPVAYSLAFQSRLIGFGAPILLSALAVLYLLFTPRAREVLDRQE